MRGHELVQAFGVGLHSGQQLLQAAATGLRHGCERIEREQEFLRLILVDVAHQDRHGFVRGDVGPQMAIDLLQLAVRTLVGDHGVGDADGHLRRCPERSTGV